MALFGGSKKEAPPVQGTEGENIFHFEKTRQSFREAGEKMIADLDRDMQGAATPEAKEKIENRKKAVTRLISARPEERFYLLLQFLVWREVDVEYGQKLKLVFKDTYEKDALYSDFTRGGFKTIIKELQNELSATQDANAQTSINLQIGYWDHLSSAKTAIEFRDISRGDDKSERMDQLNALIIKKDTALTENLVLETINGIKKDLERAPVEAELHEARRRYIEAEHKRKKKAGAAEAITDEEKERIFAEILEGVNIAGMKIPEKDERDRNHPTYKERDATEAHKELIKREVARVAKEYNFSATQAEAIAKELRKGANVDNEIQVKWIENALAALRQCELKIEYEQRKRQRETSDQRKQEFETIEKEYYAAVKAVKKALREEFEKKKQAGPLPEDQEKALKTRLEQGILELSAREVVRFEKALNEVKARESSKAAKILNDVKNWYFGLKRSHRYMISAGIGLGGALLGVGTMGFAGFGIPAATTVSLYLRRLVGCLVAGVGGAAAWGAGQEKRMEKKARKELIGKKAEKLLDSLKEDNDDITGKLKEFIGDQKGRANMRIIMGFSAAAVTFIVGETLARTGLAGKALSGAKEFAKDYLDPRSLSSLFEWVKDGSSPSETIEKVVGPPRPPSSGTGIPGGGVPPLPEAPPSPQAVENWKATEPPPGGTPKGIPPSEKAPGGPAPKGAGSPPEAGKTGISPEPAGAPKAAESIFKTAEYSEQAVIKKGEGIWHAVERQLRYQLDHSGAQDFAKKFGFRPEDVTANKEKILDRATWKLLNEQGYIQPHGGKGGGWIETRIAKPGVRVFLDGDGRIQILGEGKTTYQWSPEKHVETGGGKGAGAPSEGYKPPTQWTPEETRAWEEEIGLREPSGKAGAQIPAGEGGGPAGAEAAPAAKEEAPPGEQFTAYEIVSEESAAGAEAGAGGAGGGAESAFTPEQTFENRVSRILGGTESDWRRVFDEMKNMRVGEFLNRIAEDRAAARADWTGSFSDFEYWWRMAQHLRGLNPTNRMLGMRIEDVIKDSLK
jgi:hypothetical protein